MIIIPQSNLDKINENSRTVEINKQTEESPETRIAKDYVV
jgi:hypothetical protein